MRWAADCHSTASGVSAPRLTALARCHSGTRPSMRQEWTSGLHGRRTASTARPANRGCSATSSGTSIRPAHAGRSTSPPISVERPRRQASHGFHLDQYGAPKRALRADGTEVDLALAFPALIDHLAGELPDRATDLQQRQQLPDLVDRRRESSRRLHRGVVTARPAHRSRETRREGALPRARAKRDPCGLPLRICERRRSRRLRRTMPPTCDGVLTRSVRSPPRRGTSRAYRGLLRPPPRAEPRE